MDLVDSDEHITPANEKAKYPTLLYRLDKFIKPQKLDMNDDNEKKGTYKKHSIQKLKLKKQFPSGRQDILKSFLRQSSKNIMSPIQCHLFETSQNTTHLNDQSYESTTDNSMDENTRDRQSTLFSPDLNFLSINNITLANRSLNTQSISQNTGFINNQQ